MSPRKYTEAVKQSNRKWDSANLDRLSIALPVGSRDKIKAHAQAQGESVNGFIGRAITETIEHDNSPIAPAQPIPQAPETPQDGLLVLVEVGYDPVAEKPLYSEKGTGKQYYVEPVPVDIEISDAPDELPF